MFNIKNKVSVPDVRVTFRMPEPMARQIKFICKENNWVFSDVIRHALDLFQTDYARQPKPKQNKFDFMG